MQRVTPGISNAFGPVEKALRENFVLAFFEGLEEGAPERGVTRLPVKQAGLDLPDPTLMAPISVPFTVDGCTVSHAPVFFACLSWCAPSTGPLAVVDASASSARCVLFRQTDVRLSRRQAK